jgi:outer membrane protein W
MRIRYCLRSEQPQIISLDKVKSSPEKPIEISNELAYFYAATTESRSGAWVANDSRRELPENYGLSRLYKEYVMKIYFSVSHKLKLTSTRSIGILSAALILTQTQAMSNEAVHSSTSIMPSNRTIPTQPSKQSRRINSISSLTAQGPRSSEAGLSHKKRLGFDVHGGIGIAGIDTTSTAPSDLHVGNTYGATVGVGIDIEMAPSFAFRPELNYLKKGLSVSNNDATASLDMHYIEIPLLLKGSTEIGKVRPNLVAGPAVAYNLSNDIRANTKDGSKSVTIYSTDVNVKKVDYGIQFGTGIEFPVNHDNAITADIRYDLGLANIDKDPGATTKTRVFLFMMGFKL